MGYTVTLRVRHGRLVESVGENSPTAREEVGVLPSTRPTIHVGDLTFVYGASAQPIVEGLHLDIPHGDHEAIVGPSGIGKLAWRVRPGLPPRLGGCRLPWG